MNQDATIVPNEKPINYCGKKKNSEEKTLTQFKKLQSSGTACNQTETNG
jgi:hypothetical protein